MDIAKIAFFGIMTALIYALVRNIKPEIAPLVILGGVAVILITLAEDIIFPADYSEGTALETTVKDIIRKMAIVDRLGEETARQLRTIGGDVLPNQVGLF